MTALSPHVDVYVLSISHMLWCGLLLPFAFEVRLSSSLSSGMLVHVPRKALFPAPGSGNHEPQSHPRTKADRPSSNDQCSMQPSQARRLFLARLRLGRLPRLLLPLTGQTLPRPRDAQGGVHAPVVLGDLARLDDLDALSTSDGSPGRCHEP